MKFTPNSIVFALATMALALTACGSASWPDKPSPGVVLPCVVEHVHDGDTVTVVVRMKMSVRLLDCWAPEITGASKSAGLKSTDRLRELAEGKSGVLMVPMGESLGKSLTFGRVLGHVWIDGNSRSLSEQMVTEGFATRTKKE